MQRKSPQAHNDVFSNGISEFAFQNNLILHQGASQKVSSRCFVIGQIKFSYKIGTLLNKINITTYFENITIELNVLYTLNTHIKFCINWILFSI